MKCSQVEKLLPLYAGHDLVEQREQLLVTEHLQSCAACSLAAAEYRAARGLMLDFSPQVFEDHVYAEMRKNVWEQIERQPRWRAIFDSVTVWFQPKAVWAVAALLMIAVSAVGLYFVNQEFTVRPTVIVDIPRVVGPVIGPAPAMIGAPLIPGEGTPNKRQANLPKRQPKPDRMVAPDHGTSLAAYSPDAEVTTLQSPSAPAIGMESTDLAAPSSEKTLRMEIQTKDPNIRIIWFLSESPNQ